MQRRIILTFLPLLLIGLAACSSGSAGPYELELMPAPAVFEGGAIDPFAGRDRSAVRPFTEILYATDRMPNDGSGGSTEQYYLHRRGHVLRLGMAELRLGEGDLDDDLAARMSLSLERTEGFPLSIAAVEEFGVLGRSFWSIMDPSLIPEDPKKAGDLFAARLDEIFERSGSRDVYVFVHGYRTGFEFPVLVAAELWHFLGYQGAFIGYSWPSRAKRLGYLADLDTAAYTTRNLRLFLEYLIERTSAERIHILGYSAGTRPVLGALGQLGLKAGPSRESTGARIGQVMLISSDFDRDQFGGLIEDGLLDTCERLTLYLSRQDKALELSRRLSGRERLGQAWVRRALSDTARQYLLRENRLAVIDATDASDATLENGHRYLRKSPWVSSDILMTLRFGFAPEERGLIRQEGDPLWTFPPDYIEELRAAVEVAGVSSSGSRR